MFYVGGDSYIDGECAVWHQGGYVELRVHALW